MAHDDDFEPKLGRIGARGSTARTYLQELRRATARAGGKSRNDGATGRTRFQGHRIGRGAGIGRVLAARDNYAAFRARRVVIKSRIVKLAGKGLNGAQLHLRYIQRDGVTREGEPGQLYSATTDRADGRGFLERSDGDRHQFRFIVSAEDATGYEDLHAPIRRLMQRMEEDLGARLDWVAVDHHNTGHPHTHVVLRGRDEQGHDLIIAREYLSHGMRERAAEIVSLDLGPRTDSEIENRLRAEVNQEHFTSLDRGLLRDADAKGNLSVEALAGQPLPQALRAGRLQRLKSLGLAEETQPGHWTLSPALETTLRQMGERGDIIKTLHRAIAREHLPRSAADCAIYDPADGKAPSLVGRVVERGLSEEISDRHYLIVDAVDGRTHYVEVGQSDENEPTLDSAVVAINGRAVEVRDADRTIAEIAAANGGRYSAEIHLRHDPHATARFAEAHVRRLEAMRRAGIEVERELDGTWVIRLDHLDRAVSYERAQARIRPVVIETLSAIALDRQIQADGATWLDKELVTSSPTPTRDAGFGREIRDALDRRRQWLIEQNLASQDQDRLAFRADLLAVLRRRELAKAGNCLSAELNLRHRELRSGEWVEGMYTRRLDLASGRFAVIESDRDFILVPWRPLLERNLGKSVAGMPRGDSISWTLGHQRGRTSVE